MIKIAIVIIAFISLSLSGKQDYPVASLHEAAMEIGPHGLIASACISIQPDGHFHIERRWQQLSSPTTTFHLYEGSLNNFQLQRLRDLIDSQNIKDLGPYAPPAIPPGLKVFSSFNVEIRREDSIQKPGYFSWDERQGKLEQSISAAQREQWHTAQTALLPLLQWFHEIEGMKWPEVPEPSSDFCDISSSPTN